MMTVSRNIEKIGFEPWFLDSVDPESMVEFDIARVMAVHKDCYTIHNGDTEALAELVGKIVYGADSPMDYPTVGDWVLVKYYDDQTFATIHDLLPRKALLKRKTPGKKIDFQLIAANIDVAFIVQSIDENFNLRRLERYLVMVNESNIKPIVLLSKIDLIDSEVVASRIDEIHQIMPALAVYPFSNETASGIKTVEDLLAAKQTFCLLGSSGVGKTTLLNNLIGDSVFKTGQVREKDGKGRHVTSHRQMNILDGGAMVVDTPGMRELGNFAVSTGLDETFDDISELTHLCRFSDCSHTHEIGCAVLKALEQGQLSEKRYQNYIKMTKEAIYNEMSYHDKRVKDKQFGLFVKTVMQHKKNRR